MHEREPTEEPIRDPEIDSAAEVEPKHRPRIYAASLSDYNDGILHGAWLDAAVEPNELHEGIAAMLAASPTATKTGQPAEEWAIHDFEEFGPLRLGEYQSVEWTTAVARGIAEHGPAFAAWASQVDSDQDRLGQFEKCYLGEWESVEAYAESFLEDIGATAAVSKLDDWLQGYIDLDVAGFARDLELGGDITAVEKSDGGVWVFDGRQ